MQRDPYAKLRLVRLLECFFQQVQREKQATLVTIEGWTPLLLDWVGFYRPHLKGNTGKHFASQAGKALPAIELGMIARPVQTQQRRFPLLCGLTRNGNTLALLQEAQLRQSKTDVLVADRQVKISHLHQADIQHFVIRGNLDFTAYERNIRPHSGRGRKPGKGAIVRPLSRSYRGKPIAATVPHRTETFVAKGRPITALWFENLVLADCPLVFRCVVIVDPRYKSPWVLLTDLEESAETIYRLYGSRWKIEQLPQTGKQLLGGQRAFVHGEESRYRLPELCLFAASLCLYLSATSKAVATGFWDRNPKPTPGRFRRVLAGAAFPDFASRESEFRKMVDFDETVVQLLSRVRPKSSVFGHLAMGVLAHRRQTRTSNGTRVTGN